MQPPPSEAPTCVSRGLPLLHADPLRLRQALDNLVSNALVHGAGGEIVVRTSLKGGNVLLAVEDHGPGIPADEQERIFDAGVRLDTRRPGTGLGLAVVRAIAEAHRGALSVQSTPGRGAMFTLQLPLA